ncbi:iron ABC transporter permease [Petroclostridium sp. X23]|uniref:ABC transporter permease n=1 Tax=Petroclostridium sp. X23 TaxID=3045146 RepID=UPI0024ACFB41|nr:iron ABC transporter permease [Petroclostridium sp. X23]WHH58758.1 iron ABC transporter permease [Petroclostridium sp. X23]
MGDTLSNGIMCREEKQQGVLFHPSFFSGIKKRYRSLLLLALVIIVFFIPIFRLLMLSFTSETAITVEHYARVLSEQKTWKVISNTVIIACGSTVLSLVLGVCMAWLVAYSDIRGKKLMQIFILLPFIIPSYIITLSWTQFMGTNGLAIKLLAVFSGDLKPWNIYSYGGMILIMGISHYPLVYMLTVSVFRKISRDMELAARMSGVNRVQAFYHITLPLALPGIASGGLLAFLASLDNFGIPAFLGIPARISVLSTMIYEEIIGYGPSAFARGAALSVILGIIALIGTLFQWWLLRRYKRFETVKEDYAPRFSFARHRIYIEVMVWIFLITISIIPVFSMAMTSLVNAYGMDFTPVNLTFRHYHFILAESQKTKNAIQNSLILGMVTTMLCLLIGTIIAYYRTRKVSPISKAVEIFVGLPYALPGMVLALAMIFTWMEPVPGWNPGIYGTIKILIIAYITRFMILQVRGSITAMMQVDRSMEEAARACGAKTASTWKKVLIPLLLPGMMSGAFMVLLSSLTELTLSSILWSSGCETIGLTIFNFEQAGYITYSTAFSTFVVLLIMIGGLAFYLFRKFWKKRVMHI